MHLKDCIISTNILQETYMKHTYFIRYINRVDELTSKQKIKLSDLLQSKDKDNVIIKTLEKRFSDVGHCPHCKHHKFQRWGKAHEMQRYRCNNCMKTFNSVTGTPLARLRKKDKWLCYSKAMIDGLSVRKAAEMCGVNKTTSFRWRHRFLHKLKDKKDKSLNGIVEADETFFLESFKGSRKMKRTPRKRGGKATKRGLSTEQIPVLIARDRHGDMTDQVLKNTGEISITKVLKPVVAHDAILCTDGNKSYQAFAKTENIKHVQLVASQNCRVIDRVYHIQNVNAYDSRLKAWMHRFKGVATKYLPNYMGWRRCLEKQKNFITPPTYFNCALG